MSHKKIVSLSLLFGIFCFSHTCFAQEASLPVQQDVSVPAQETVVQQPEPAQETVVQPQITVQPQVMVQSQVMVQPTVVDPSQVANAPANQNQVSSGQPRSNSHLVGRIFSDLGFSILYEGAFGLLGTLFIFSGVMDYSISSMWLGIGIIFAGTFVSPGLAVHTSHAILNGMGRPGLGYAGSALGALGGGLIGALGYISGPKVGSPTTISFAIIGSIVGAITWYELSDKQAREGDFAFTNIYPVIELNDQRKVFGIGLQF